MRMVNSKPAAVPKPGLTSARCCGISRLVDTSFFVSSSPVGVSPTGFCCSSVLIGGSSVKLDAVIYSALHGIAQRLDRFQFDDRLGRDVDHLPGAGIAPLARRPRLGVELADTGK